MSQSRRGFLRLAGGAVTGAGIAALAADRMSGKGSNSTSSGKGLNSSSSSAKKDIETSKLDIRAQAFPAPRGKSQEAVDVGRTGWLPGEQFVGSSQTVKVADFDEKFDDFLLAEDVFVGINSDEIYAINYLNGEDLRASIGNRINSVSLNKGEVGFVTDSAFGKVGIGSKSIDTGYSIDLAEDAELFSMNQADIAVDNDQIAVFTDDYKKNVELSSNPINDINTSTVCIGDSITFLDENGVMYDRSVDELIDQNNSHVQFTELGDIVDGDATETSVSKNDDIIIAGKNALGYISEDMSETGTVQVPGMNPNRPITDGESIVVPNQQRLYFAELEDSGIVYNGSREFGDIVGVYGLGENVLVSGENFTQILDPANMEDTRELPADVIYADSFRVLKENNEKYTLHVHEMNEPYGIEFQDGDVMVTNETGRDILTHVTAEAKDDSYQFEDVYRMIEKGETLQLDLKSDLNLHEK